VAVQSVFAMLDVLSSWTSKSRSAAARDRDISSKNKAKSTAKEEAPSSPITPAKEGDHPFKDSPCMCVTALLSAVPKDALGRAALRIKAYARALRYFEMHAREGKRSTGAEIFDLSTSTSTSTALLPSTNTKSLPPTFCPRDDGSNGELPALTGSQLDLLVDVFANLEDPDALQGVQILR
jgi:hypothetical protein